MSLPTETSESSSFRLQPGNRLEIEVYREDDLSGIYEIDPYGRMAFPLVGTVQAAGMSMEALREDLTERLRRYLVDPYVMIKRGEAAIKSISLLGKVAKRGTFDFAPGASLMGVVSEAGGFAPSANARKIKIIRKETGGKKKVIVVNGNDIIRGRRDDVNLEPGDVIYVPESIF